MAYEEKSAWILGILAILTYAVYLTIILSMAASAPLTEIDYAPVVLWTIGASIVVSILVHIVVGIVTRAKIDKRDQRDRQIARFGTGVGNAFLVIGGLAAMLLALFELGYFWIANVLYLCFVLSGIAESIAKVVAYRRGIPAW